MKSYHQVDRRRRTVRVGGTKVKVKLSEFFGILFQNPAEHFKSCTAQTGTSPSRGKDRIFFFTVDKRAGDATLCHSISLLAGIDISIRIQKVEGCVPLLLLVPYQLSRHFPQHQKKKSACSLRPASKRKKERKAIRPRPRFFPRSLAPALVPLISLLCHRQPIQQSCAALIDKANRTVLVIARCQLAAYCYSKEQIFI